VGTPRPFDRDAGPLQVLVRELLHDLQPDADLVEFLDSPPEHYTVRIALPGQLGKTLILSRRLLEAARVNPVALRSVRLLLRTELSQQQTSRALERAREARASRAVIEGPIGICDICEKPIRIHDRVVVRQARVAHARCLPRALDAGG